MFRAESLETIADVLDHTARADTAPGTVQRRHAIATLDVLAEDLVGRDTPRALELKARVHALRDRLTAGG
ncbi:hypothetical protein JL107_06030 [Nakamurella flavida]|uniref:Uncharacterized protein n=1 Tax=Nakamurella flavida TaxID=363630 RepID=A0A939C2G4_9ACTN|nr:hypothetical protein [Nakamurella flavida]MBM9475996.1 hypothetical protein [Nakamurella flavida]MDP9777261.1 hypothetical protein [Nakamurella flavida]